MTIFPSPRHSISPPSRKLQLNWDGGRGPDGVALDQQGRLYPAGGRIRPPRWETTTERKAGVCVLLRYENLLKLAAVAHHEVINCPFGGKSSNNVVCHRQRPIVVASKPYARLGVAGRTNQPASQGTTARAVPFACPIRGSLYWSDAASQATFHRRTA